MNSIQKNLLFKNILYCIFLGTVLLSLVTSFNVDNRLEKGIRMIVLRLHVLQTLALP